MNQWQIGAIKITRVIEMEVAGGSRFILPDATREAVLPIKWLAPHFMTEDGRLIMSIHALIVETPRQTIIVDTCIGNDKQRGIPNWTNLQLPFLQDLADAGYPSERIDTVLCTHLHVDHVGWNTMLVDGNWVPTFPNARYLMGSKEFDYWDSEDDGSEPGNIMTDSVRPVFDAGLVDLVEMDHSICEEVRLQPTPGHTPGHVSVHISSEGEQALITGDSFHHPCQIARIEWSSSADSDPAQAIQTRTGLLDRYADEEILIIGTHFATPTAGHFRKDKSDYWFEALVD
jgi:glyoxylase-like metal-dependent hydrolase (beta-lactamase superfamily II)|tara:strand:+ start:3138 stop:3998 length:861 start_codon:yes stop_codon:yes gene_type:complete